MYRAGESMGVANRVLLVDLIDIFNRLQIGLVHGAGEFGVHAVKDAALIDFKM